MTPSLFDLPLRLGDASALAAILLDSRLGVTPPAGYSGTPKPLTDDIRARVAARLSGAEFEHMRPLVASLERDPVHPSASYLCVDGVDNQPLLLRVAPATTPSSGIFPRAILIGRTFVGSVETVLNAIPFGPRDREQILVFSEEVNRAFAPRPFGSRPVTRVRSDAPESTFPAVFEGFRQMLRNSGRVAACLALEEGQDPEAFYFTAVWSAIRAGWREGYTLQAPSSPAIHGLRRRPFETDLTIARDIRLGGDTRLGDDIRLSGGMTRDEILAAF